MTKPRILLTLILVLAATASLADPVEWPVAEGGNGHYYEARSQAVYWDGAQSAAAGLSWQGCPGHLATITSAEECAFILDHVGGHGGYWLGGYQADGSSEPDGGWRWITDEPWGFTYWAPGEPNNDGNEKYLITVWWDESNDWNDEEVPPYDAFGYFVEYEPPVAVTGSSWGRVKATYR
jgi:hypothetical protein